MGSGQDVTYSPKFARYQKTIRDLQVERAEKMLQSGILKQIWDRILPAR